MAIIKDLEKHLKTLLKHKHLKLVLILMVTIYSALLAPALPNSVIKFFDTIPGKLLFVFLIGYTASKNIQVALIVAIGFIVTLQIIERRKIENYINYIENFKDDEDGDEDNSDDEDTDDNDKKPKKNDTTTCIKALYTIKEHATNAHHACSGTDLEGVSGANKEDFASF